MFGGADELDKEDLHEDSGDDQDLDVREVLGVYEGLDYKVLIL